MDIKDYPIIKLINGDEHHYCSLKDYDDYLLVEFRGTESKMKVKIPKINILWWQI